MKLSADVLHIFSTASQPFELAEAQFERGKARWLCSECHYPLPFVRSVDVLVEAIPGMNRTALNVVINCGVAVARRDLLMTLGAEAVSNNLYVGKVVLRSGKIIPELVTFRGRTALVVRRNSSQNPKRRMCPGCNREFYWNGAGRACIDGGLLDGLEVAESHIWGLLFKEETGRSLSAEAWPGVARERVAVVEHVPDGLTKSMPWVAGKEGNAGCDVTIDT